MRILIGEDDPIVRRLMRELLGTIPGYEVVEATDGPKCWQALNSGLSPDLCIFDVMMPGMGGLELLAMLRADNRFEHQKVILCSCLNDRATVTKAGSLRVEGYLVKPFPGKSLLELVKRVCENGQSQRRPTALEPMDAAVKRLGIGKELYLELVNAFTTQVRDILDRSANWPAAASWPDLELRLVSARGAGMSLGAESAVAALRKLESAFAVGVPSAVATSLEIVKEEIDRVIAAVGGSAESTGKPEVVERLRETTPRG